MIRRLGAPTEAKGHKWAGYHPHVCRASERNNTLYVSGKQLKLVGSGAEKLQGAGVFHRYSEELQLTAASASSPSLWELPRWLYPCNGRAPLTYHGDPGRWQRTGRGTRLRTVARGQEFVLDCEEYPEAMGWLRELLDWH